MVYVFLADGFEEVEALTPVDYLRRCGVQVLTVGVTGKMVTGSHQISVEADIVVSEMDLEQVEMILLPGGIPGVPNLEASGEVQKAIDYCVQHEKYIAAICAAPSILGKKGLLKGKRATAYPSFVPYLYDAKVQENGVYQDGKVITASSVFYADQFAYYLANILCGEEAVKDLKEKVLDTK